MSLKLEKFGPDSAAGRLDGHKFHIKARDGRWFARIGDLWSGGADTGSEGDGVPGRAELRNLSYLAVAKYRASQKIAAA